MLPNKIDKRPWSIVVAQTKAKPTRKICLQTGWANSNVEEEEAKPNEQWLPNPSLAHPTNHPTIHPSIHLAIQPAVHPSSCPVNQSVKQKWGANKGKKKQQRQNINNDIKLREFHSCWLCCCCCSLQHLLTRPGSGRERERQRERGKERQEERGRAPTFTAGPSYFFPIY